MDNTLSGTVLSTKLGSGKRKRYVGVYGTEGCSKNGHALALFRRDCSSNGVATTGTPRPTHSVYWHKKLGAEWSHIVRTQGCHCSDCPRACGSMSHIKGLWQTLAHTANHDHLYSPWATSSMLKEFPIIPTCLFVEKEHKGVLSVDDSLAIFSLVGSCSSYAHPLSS